MGFPLFLRARERGQVESTGAGRPPRPLSRGARAMGLGGSYRIVEKWEEGVAWWAGWRIFMAAGWLGDADAMG